MAVSIIGEAAVRLRPNAEGFQSEAEVGILGPLQEVAGKAAGFFAAAFAAQKVGAFIKDSITQASNLNESTSKVGVVFGQASQQVIDFASNAAASMGQSRQQALEATGTFGNLFRAIGLGQGQSATMSTNLVKLAGDLASFNNIDPAQALDALRSGLVGETEPLRSLGVNLNQAALQQQALKMGLDASGPTLSSAVTAQAAYALILQQTSLAQGDFSRTSGGLANQTRILSAQFTDLKGQVGQGFLPFVNIAAQGLTSTLMPALLGATAGISAFGTKAQNSLQELENVTKATYNGTAVAADDWQSRVGISLGNFAQSAQGAWWVFATNAKGGTDAMLQQEPTLIGFLSRIGQGVHGVAQNASSAWMSIRTDASNALAPLAGQLAPTWDSIKASISQVFEPAGITASGSGFFRIINELIGKVTPLISGWIQSLTPMLASVLPAIGNAVAGLVPIISGIVGQIGPMLSSILPVIVQIAGLTATLWKTAFAALAPVIPPIVTAIGQLVSTLVSGLAPILQQIAPLISTLINTAVGQFSAILKALVPIIPPLVNVLATLAQIIVGALLQVLQALLPVLPVLAQAFGSIAQAVGGALIQAVNALAPILPTLLNAFISLIQAALQPLLPLLPVITSLIPPLVSIIVALVNAVVPFLPLIVQVVTMLVQLAVVAIQPLLPIIQILANLLVLLVTVLTPIINVGLSLVAVLVNIAGVILQTVVAAVSGVIGWFQHLLVTLSGIGASISSTLGHIFDGIAGAAGAAFNAVTGVIRGAVNGIIGIINSAIGFINRDMIGLLNKIPGVNIPNIPNIPRLHSGGIFTSGSPSGEGLALLRDAELVATPEQQNRANRLLQALLDGQIPAPASPAAPGAAPITINEHVYAAPGQDPAAIAAQATRGVVWNLSSGITRPVGAGATL